jgi:hypothetical protein
MVSSRSGFAAAGARASFNLEILGSGALPDDAFEVADRTIVLVTVGVRALAKMRVWRKGYLKPKLEAMAVQGRGPTLEEWVELERRAAGLHTIIQGTAERTPAGLPSSGGPAPRGRTGLAWGGQR